MRLIDADALKEEVNKKKVVGRFNTIMLIDNAPTVDTPTYTDIIEANKEGYNTARRLYKRPQGKWIEGGKDVTGQYFYDEFICNKCSVVVDNKSNFCPRCGADMRKGGAE